MFAELLEKKKKIILNSQLGLYSVNVWSFFVPKQILFGIVTKQIVTFSAPTCGSLVSFFFFL